MATFVFISAMGFSALLDMAMAAAIMHGFALFFCLPLFWYHYCAIAPFIGVFPDLDALFQLSSEKKIDDAHHTILHRPFLMAVGGFLGGAFFFGYPWGIIIMLSWLAHHLHDSCCLDFGLKWFWPFSDKNFHFLGRMSLGKKKSARFRLVHIYTPEELEKLKDQFIEVQKWLKLVYYKPTSYSIVELYMSAVLLFFVVFSYHAEIAAIVWMLTMASGVTFWTLAKKYAP